MQDLAHNPLVNCMTTVPERSVQDDEAPEAADQGTDDSLVTKAATLTADLFTNPIFYIVVGKHNRVLGAFPHEQHTRLALVAHALPIIPLHQVGTPSTHRPTQPGATHQLPISSP